MNKKHIALIVCGVFVVWAGSGIAINGLINASYRGTFGDMFGAVNALFSGLAFGGLIYTIFLQMAENRRQQQEAKDMNEKMMEQVRLSNVQRFESTLFLTVQMHHDIVKNINIKGTSGRDAFFTFYNLLIKEYMLVLDEEYGIKTIDFPADFNRELDDDYIKETILHEQKVNSSLTYAIQRAILLNEQALGTYVRNLTNIYRMIDENSSLSREERVEYIRLINSQLSLYEYIMLFYYCFLLSSRELKAYADKYEIFHNMNPFYLISIGHWQLYDKLKW